MNNTANNSITTLSIPQNNSDKKAIIYINESISYAELKSIVMSLSTELKQVGVSKGDFVAIYMSNSIDMVLSILATLNCSAIVVPINIDLPSEQIIRILSECNPKVILHNRNQQIDFKNHKTFILNYKKLDTTNGSDNDMLVYDPRDLAYCIFTSGSSGIPKGVLLTYEGVFNHIESKIDFLKLTSESRLCLSFNIGFVASIWQVLTPILLGAQLYIYDNDLIKKPYQFLEQLERDKINVISMIPQSLYAYCNYIGDNHQKLALPHMKKIILTGEKVDKVVVDRFYEAYTHISLVNAYGQSECSDDTFHFEVPHDFADSDIPIGKPIPNILYLILDKNLKEVPIGDKGELFIGGECLAQSYLNNELLTSEKTVIISNNTFYRTGDIVRLNQNDDVVCLGRADNQIKIHGHLVEPEEIEAHLNKIDGVTQAVVFAVETSEVDKILAVYYTSDNEIDSKEILKYLSSKLPAYMIPAIFKRVERFFFNSNGKVDRKRALEYIEIKSTEDKTESCDLNERLNDVQRRAFDVIIANVSDKITEDISLDTDLKSIGLDSISFIQTVVNLETEFDFEFDDGKLQITEFPTVNSMIEYIESNVFGRTLRL
ncbi:MAG: non-ribosomal peptide synthetase [Eubacteriales bacterium]|nr:non-ribosomal peptide synthetase [Eubacteriales bacterium]